MLPLVEIGPLVSDRQDFSKFTDR